MVKKKKRRSKISNIITSPFSIGTWIGSNGRAILGVIVILLDLIMFVIDTLGGEKVTTADALLHIGLLIAGIALIDREKASDLIAAYRGRKSE